MSDKQLIRGEPYPLGATLREDGVNFAIYSEYAETMEIEFYGANDKYPGETVELKEHDGYVWHTFVPGIKKGQLYGLRVGGKYDPSNGLRFNRNKLLIDPYARALSGKINWDKSIFSYDQDSPDQDLAMNNEDSSPFVPKSIVIDPQYDWKGVKKPKHPWAGTVIYETHVKGISIQRDDIQEKIRGTYSALASESMIQYFRDLGITSLELMPIHHHVDDMFLVNAGLSNYWGYNTIGYFAPDIRYASGAPGSQVVEFKDMVRKLHENGIEIILDVVYNHTAEGNNLGPTLSFKGIDNITYYKLQPGNKRFYEDFTGTGNSLDARQPAVLQLIMDSLRYWATEMQIDGFRFDLASTLARELYNVNMLSPFLATIHQDPIISNLKLIAEPWDVGPGGYQVGNFPPKWAEWNGKYRDQMRRFWRGEDGMLGNFATRLSGSPDLYKDKGKLPKASVNFITCHDGFTLCDLVSYKHKHNEANPKGFEGGSDENFSMNFGIEGNTDDEQIRGQRFRMMKNFILTLMVSQGVPMILGGDEIARTQNGNNNSFCQDNKINWFNWALNQEKNELLKFTRHMIMLRRSNPVLRRRNFFKETLPDADLKEILWMDSTGNKMTPEKWNRPDNKSLMIWISGHYTSEIAYSGEFLTGGDLLLLFNSGNSPVNFILPDDGTKWELYADTNLSTIDGLPISIDGRNYLLNKGASAVIRERT